MVGEHIMKNIRRISGYVFAAVVSVMSCQMIDEQEFSDSCPVEVPEGEIFARIETEYDTRTSLNENNNVIWSSDDRLTVFNKSSVPQTSRIQDKYVGKNYGSFSPVDDGQTDGSHVPDAVVDHVIAYYPCTSGVECRKAESSEAYELKGISIPSEQVYSPDSFGNGTFPMVAVSKDNNIVFRNVCGGLRLLLKGNVTVTGIKVSGHKREKLSGEATLTAYTDGTVPAIAMSYNASTETALICPEGVGLNENVATEFILTMPPVKFEEGFTVTVTDIDGKTSTITTFKENTISRSNLLTMPEVMVGGDAQADAIVPYLEMGPINTQGNFGIQWWGQQYYRTPDFYESNADKISICPDIDCDVKVYQYDSEFKVVKIVDFSSLKSNVYKDYSLLASCKYVSLLFRKDSSIPDFEKPSVRVTGLLSKEYFNTMPVDAGYQRLVIPVEIDDPALSDKKYLPDYGMLALPKNYSNTGEPTRLIIYCHGAGTNYSSSITRFPSSALLPEYWLSEGYAVMDIEGNPFDNSTPHSYVPYARKTYELAYEWVVNTYNICRDGVFLGGRSLGGGMCFEILQSEIPVIAACPLVPACNQLWYWTYLTAARKKFLVEKSGVTASQPSWTSSKKLSETEIKFFYDHFDELMDSAPFWRGIVDLPDKDILFKRASISASTKYDEEEAAIFSSLKFRSKAPVKLFGCHEDNVVPSRRNAELMYKMLQNAGVDCELALYHTDISAPHHFELQDPVYMTDITNSAGEAMNVPLIYVEMLKYWQKYE